jgi:hypothetical protein
MHAHFLGAPVLVLSFAVSAQEPMFSAVPLLDVPAEDATTMSHPEPGCPGNATMIDYFSAANADFYAKAGASFVEAGALPSSESGLLELPRFSFTAPPGGRKIDVSAEEFFDAVSQSYAVKRTIAVPLQEDNSPVAFKVQANQTTLPASRLAFPPVDENGVIGAGLVGLDAKWLDPSKERLEMAFTYRYDLARVHGVGSSLKYTLPELFAPVHVYARPEIQVNSDGSNHEKLSLAVWSDVAGAIRPTPVPRLAAIVGIRRQEAPAAGRHLHETFALDWGALLRLTERFSTGVNMSYSWDVHGFGALFYMELKAPARTLRGSLGGVYEPGIP